MLSASPRIFSQGMGTGHKHYANVSRHNTSPPSSRNSHQPHGLHCHHYEVSNNVRATEGSVLEARSHNFAGVAPDQILSVRVLTVVKLVGPEYCFRCFPYRQLGALPLYSPGPSVWRDFNLSYTLVADTVSDAYRTRPIPYVSHLFCFFA